MRDKTSDTVPFAMCVIRNALLVTWDTCTYKYTDTIQMKTLASAYYTEGGISKEPRE